MVTKRGPQGPLQGEARRGFDAAYAERPKEEREDLGEVGFKSQDSIHRNDTGMKNPDGDLQAPSAKPAGKA